MVSRTRRRHQQGEAMTTTDKFDLQKARALADRVDADFKKYTGTSDAAWPLCVMLRAACVALEERDRVLHEIFTLTDCPWPKDPQRAFNEIDDKIRGLGIFK